MQRLEVSGAVRPPIMVVRRQRVYEGVVYSFSHTALWSVFFSFLWRFGPSLSTVSSFLRFLDHTQRCATVGRTPLDE